MTVFQQGIISLVRAAITGNTSPIPDGFTLEHLDVFAKKHQITSVLLYGVVALGLDSSHPAVKNLYVRSGAEIILSEKQQTSFDDIKAKFLEEKIDFIPLKGVVVKTMYPKPEMRSMGDIDILIRECQYQNIKSILFKSGYTELYESDHEYAWKTPNGVFFELHKSLMPTYFANFYEHFGEGWKLAIKTGEGSEFSFSPENEFLYLFTHFAKHYISGGIGIKHLIDLWIYKKQNNLNYKLIRDELSKLNLLEFYDNIEKVENFWFYDEKPDEIVDFITDVIFKSGAYGTHNARVYGEVLRISRSENSNKVSKFRLFLRKAFPSYSVLYVKYKFLRNKKILLPVAWVVRAFDVLCHNPKNIVRHAKDIRISDNDKVNEFEEQLSKVGLNDCFKEKP